MGELHTTRPTVVNLIGTLFAVVVNLTTLIVRDLSPPQARGLDWMVRLRHRLPNCHRWGATKPGGVEVYPQYGIWSPPTQ